MLPSCNSNVWEICLLQSFALFIFCPQYQAYIYHGTRRWPQYWPHHIAFDHQPQLFKIDYRWTQPCPDPFNTSCNKTYLLHGAQYCAIRNQRPHHRHTKRQCLLWWYHHTGSGKQAWRVSRMLLWVLAWVRTRSPWLDWLEYSSNAS